MGKPEPERIRPGGRPGIQPPDRPRGRGHSELLVQPVSGKHVLRNGRSPECQRLAAAVADTTAVPGRLRLSRSGQPNTNDIDQPGVSVRAGLAAAGPADGLPLQDPSGARHAVRPVARHRQSRGDRLLVPPPPPRDVRDPGRRFLIVGAHRACRSRRSGCPLPFCCPRSSRLHGTLTSTVRVRVVNYPQEVHHERVQTDIQLRAERRPAQGG